MQVFSNQITVDNTPLPITGALTDTELRATPVPVTIPTPVPVTDNGGSLTVDGTITVANPGLTDAELRATPVPISGTVAVNNFPSASTNAATITSVSVSTTVTTLSAENAAKKQVVIHNENGTLFVKLGSGASSTSYSFRLTANTVVTIDGYYGIVTATKLTGTSNALVTEIGI